MGGSFGSGFVSKFGPAVGKGIYNKAISDYEVENKLKTALNEMNLGSSDKMTGMSAGVDLFGDRETRESWKNIESEVDFTGDTSLISERLKKREGDRLGKIYELTENQREESDYESKKKKAELEYITARSELMKKRGESYLLGDKGGAALKSEKPKSLSSIKEEMSISASAIVDAANWYDVDLKDLGEKGGFEAMLKKPLETQKEILGKYDDAIAEYGEGSITSEDSLVKRLRKHIDEQEKANVEKEEMDARKESGYYEEGISGEISDGIASIDNYMGVTRELAKLESLKLKGGISSEEYLKIKRLLMRKRKELDKGKIKKRDGYVI
jgi:hypothetical protein